MVHWAKKLKSKIKAQQIQKRGGRRRRPPLFVFMCSRQESNLDRQYRKLVFYPLNYESNDATLPHPVIFFKKQKKRTDFKIQFVPLMRR